MPAFLFGYCSKSALSLQIAQKLRKDGIPLHMKRDPTVPTLGTGNFSMMMKQST